jgi:hypothetical protein
MLRGVKSLEEIRVASNLERCIFVDLAKTISSRNDMIVEIISPFAFTFKIPFH